MKRYLTLIAFALAIFVPAEVAAISANDFNAVVNNTIYADPEANSNICSSDATVSLSGDNNAIRTFSYFVGLGYSPAQAAGIVGNLEYESGIAPEREENNPMTEITTADQMVSSGDANNTKIGWGIAQFTPSNKIITPLEQQGQTSATIGTLASQLVYLAAPVAGLTQLKAATNPTDAAFAFFKYYERPLDQSPTSSSALSREADAVAWYNWEVNGIAVPAGIASGVVSGAAANPGATVGDTATPTVCATPTPTATTGTYMNPLRDVKNGTSGPIPERIDQGVDYGGTGPVYAIGDGKIISARTTGTGWPGLGTNEDGAFIRYELTDGPANGKFVYFAEDCKPLVSDGQVVTSSTVICDMYRGGTDVETGWASPSANNALAKSEYTKDGLATSYGQNFSAFMKSLGAPPGDIGRSSGISPKPLPAGWPTWQ